MLPSERPLITCISYRLMITPRCAPAVLVCVENRRWRPDDKKGSVLPYLYDALTHLSTGATISNKMTESGNLLLGPRVKSSRTGMEPRDVSYNSKDFIKTGTNLISRKAVIKNPQRVEMRGRCIVEDNVTLRGDLAVIRVGRYCLIEGGTSLVPCKAVQDGATINVTMTVGNLTHIGKRCSIEAAYIGSNVEIGDDCKISPRCIIKDCCRIEDKTVLPPDAVIPPFSLVAGNPGRVVGELPPSMQFVTKERAVAYHRHFRPAAAATR